MMRFVFLLAALLASPCLYAQSSTALDPITDLDSANRRLEEAHMAFERGDTRDAMNLYVKVAQSGYATPSIWTNAGTAAYRSGDNGRAVLYYRRALQLDPSYDRALKSFEFVSPATNTAGETFRAEFLESIFRRTSPVFWVLLGEFFYILVCFSLVRMIVVRDRDRRGHWGAIFGWNTAFLLLAAAVAFGNYHYRQGGSNAVVIDDRTITRSEPHETGKAQLELPAGTVLELTDRPQRGFVRFKLADGRTGFIPMENIEKI